MIPAIFKHIQVLRNPWKDPQEIHAMRELKLKRILHHAYAHVPFYRELFDKHNIKPDDIAGSEDLAKLPIITKKDILDIPIEKRTANSVDVKACIHDRTSGMTGLPLEILSSSSDAAHQSILFLRAYIASSVFPWHRKMIISTSRVALKDRSLYDSISRPLRKNICYLDPVKKWSREMQSWNPDILIGDITVLKLSAEIMQQQQIQVKLKKVISWGGMLDAYTQKYLESVYGCNVLDLYGCKETGIISWKCSACGGYHINSDSVIIETVKDGRLCRPGEAGEIVATTLDSYAMPFIRYSIGDTVILSDKPPVCGRSFPLMKKILGRNDDIILLKDGSKIPSQPFYHCIEAYGGIHRWQIVQESKERITLRIETNSNYKNEYTDKIKRSFIDITHNQLAVQVTREKKIDFDCSKKYKTVISSIE
ncbi:phenylacetate--CoA ligase family protein [Spirochaetota bacterium]